MLAVTLVNGISRTWKENVLKPFEEALAVRLVQFIVDHPGPVCTFNGAAFDFKVIDNLIPRGTLRDRWVSTCLHNHVDIFFDFFTSMGYFASMNSFCAGSGTPGKTWSGAESAKAVKEAMSSGDADQCADVVDRLEAYCVQDTKCLHGLVLYLQNNACLHRTSGNGKLTAWVPWELSSFRTVSNCLRAWQLAPVTCSWMQTPPPSPPTLLAWIL